MEDALSDEAENPNAALKRLLVDASSSWALLVCPLGWWRCFALSFFDEGAGKLGAPIEHQGQSVAHEVVQDPAQILLFPFHVGPRSEEILCVDQTLQ